MNRAEFLRQLECLLQNISPTEREEALQYYNDYFDDAGAENEQAVIEALGTPARVAENIKRDLYGAGYGGEETYGRTPVRGREVMPYRDDVSQAGTQNAGQQEEPGKKEKLSVGWIILIVSLCIIASPVILGVASGILGLVMGALGSILGLIAGWFGLIIGFGAAAVALFFVMLLLLVLGFSSLFYSPLVGSMLLAGGLICGGVAILFLMLTVAMARIITPAIFRGIGILWHKLFPKEEPA